MPQNHKDPMSWAEKPSADGWDNLNGSPAEQAEASKAAEDAALAQYENDKMIFDVLATGRGLEFMDWLERVTIRQPTFVAGAQEVEPGSLTILPAEQQGFFREGQNSMFRYFEAAIKRAQAGPPTAQAQNTTGATQEGTNQ